MANNEQSSVDNQCKLGSTDENSFGRWMVVIVFSSISGICPSHLFVGAFPFASNVTLRFMSASMAWVRFVFATLGINFCSQLFRYSVHKVITRYGYLPHHSLTHTHHFIKRNCQYTARIDADNYRVSLCSADTIFTYHQNTIGITHYLFFLADNDSGKSETMYMRIIAKAYISSSYEPGIKAL